jgi:cobalt-zinc-cadmium resistance protein CzcA
MFGELIIMIVYLPILALVGIEGKLFRPMALTVIFALIGSMAMSLTLVPVLASLLLPKRLSHRENFLVRGLKRIYRPALEAAIRNRWIVVGVAVVLLGNGVFVATHLGSEFVPKLKEGTLVINTVRLASVSLDESKRTGLQVERLLLEKFPDEIERVWTRTGSAEVATDPMGVELSDVFVSLKPRDAWKRASTQDELVTEMQHELEVLPGMRALFTQPIEMRVNEMVAGVRADVGVKLFGDDYDVLREKAEEIEKAIKKLPGAADVVTEQVSGLPVLQIQVDSDATSRHGIAKDDVLDVVRALGTYEVGELQDGDRRFPITVRIADRYRTDAAAVGRILVTAANGDRLPLSRLATIKTVEGPSTVQREWGKRRVVIQANVRDRDVGSFVADVRHLVDTQISLPPGYYVRFGGQFEHLEAAKSRLMIVVPIALALILVLLYFTYGRALDVILVFTGVPLATVGGIVALWLRDLPFSISAGVGFIALFGVATLNGMVLVSTFRALLADGLSLAEAVRQAALRRLRPVLMTALVASLGFVPMALNTGLGAEVQRPLATVVIGGIISSTLLTLFLLPVMFAWFGKAPELPRAVELAAPSDPVSAA